MDPPAPKLTLLNGLPPASMVWTPDVLSNSTCPPLWLKVPLLIKLPFIYIQLFCGAVNVPPAFIVNDFIYRLLLSSTVTLAIPFTTKSGKLPELGVKYWAPVPANVIVPLSAYVFTFLK